MMRAPLEVRYRGKRSIQREIAGRQAKLREAAFDHTGSFYVDKIVSDDGPVVSRGGPRPDKPIRSLKPFWLDGRARQGARGLGRGHGVAPSRKSSCA